VPSSGSVLDLAAANWTTALGAACFFAGALMLISISSDRGEAQPAAGGNDRSR